MTEMQKRLDEAIDAVGGPRLTRVALPSLTARRCLRELAGITQKDLAIALGWPTASVNCYEGSRIEPEGDKRVAYRDALVALAKRVLRDLLAEFPDSK